MRLHVHSDNERKVRRFDQWSLSATMLITFVTGDGLFEVVFTFCFFFYMNIDQVYTLSLVIWDECPFAKR